MSLIFFQVIKKILFPLFSLFLLYRSYEIFSRLLKTNPSDYSLIETLIYGFLLNLFLTGVFAFIGFAYPSSKVLPKSYYSINHEKQIKMWYIGLGVKYFRYALLLFFWGKGKNKKKFFDGSRRGLKNMDFETRQAEFGHLGAFVVLLLSALTLLVFGYFLLFIWIMIINALGNLYPVILQRYHRIRLQKLLNR